MSFRDSLERDSFIAEKERFEYLANHYPPAEAADSLVDNGNYVEWLMMKQAIRANQNNGTELWSFIIGNASFMLLIVLPLFAFLLKIVWYKKQMLYTEHFVFSAYLHAFIILNLILLQIIHWIFGLYLWWILFIVLLPYLLIALKKVYENTWITILGRCAIVSVLYFLVIVPVCFLGFILISLIGF